MTANKKEGFLDMTMLANHKTKGGNFKNVELEDLYFYVNTKSETLQLLIHLNIYFDIIFVTIVGNSRQKFLIGIRQV